MASKRTTPSLAGFVESLYANEIVARGGLKGCSEEELASIERRYSVTLPASYRAFLATMGHDAGRLFRYDHWAITFDRVSVMTHDQRDLAKEEGTEGDLERILGRDGLIIVGRLGEQFLFIHCGDGADPAVHYFENATWRTRRAYGSVREWLEAIREECIEAIESGYFDAYPNGTRP